MMTIPSLDDWARTAFDMPQTLLATLPEPLAVEARRYEIEAARRAAKQLQAALPRAVMPTPAPAPANASMASKTPDEIDARILAGMSNRPAAPKVAREPYKLLTRDNLASTPLMRDLLKGILPRYGTAGWYGASMAGKGFLLIDLIAVLATGGVWFGLQTEQIFIVYVILEGAGGMPKRILAWEKHHGTTYPSGVRFITQSLDLRNAGDIEALIEAIRDAGFSDGLVVIDTLNQASPGADENSSRDMGELIAAAKNIQEALGGLVMLVSHVGKDQSRGLRGHSSLLAALDAAVEVRRDGDRREWLVAKTKDDADGAVYPFRLPVIEIGEGEDGDPITSCVVEPEENAKSATRSKLPKGGNQRIAWDALGELLRASKSLGKGGAPATRPCVELEAAVKAIAPRLTCEEKRQPERTRQALTGLIASKLVEHRGGWLWLP